MTPNSNKFPCDDYLFPEVPESSRLLVGCRREDYSASRIARAVEDCDAHLLNLNVTSMTGAGAFDHADDGGKSFDFDDAPDDMASRFPVVFDLRVSHRSPEGISRSLERYGYTVIDMEASESIPDDAARTRLDHLLRYLEI